MTKNQSKPQINHHSPPHHFRNTVSATTETLPPYWCYHCEKQVFVKTITNLPDLICSDCKNGFVESIPTPSHSRSPSSSSDDFNFGSQFLQDP
ncbi:zinc-finger protein [Medicago truncatula]|uniref:RING-type E3 ubiquitin transferase n=1 Tax=Medicago truncatula TaxID=3880 RepID=G7K7Y6_MEDTR|nr:zinc-finger protein [Medicago truncatula]